MGRKATITSFILGLIIAGSGVYFVQREHMNTVLETQAKIFDVKTLQADLKISNLQFELTNWQQKYNDEHGVQSTDPKVTENGSFFGAISDYGSDDDITLTIGFDSMQWFSNEDGTCTELYPPPQGVSHCPNGASGKNVEVQMDTLELSNSVSITEIKINDLCEPGDSEIIDVASFINSLTKSSECGENYYHITMKDGLVTTIVQQYLP